MGFYKHCDDASCVYDDPTEGRVRLDRPTTREILTNRYRCWKCGETQAIDEHDRAEAVVEVLDRLDALEEKIGIGVFG